MKITFKLSFDNYYEYNRIYSKISVGKNLETIFKLGVFEAVVGLAVLFFRLIQVLHNNTSIVLGAILAVVGIYMMLHSKYFFYARMKREVKDRFKSEYFKNERNIELEDDHIITSSETDDYRANFNEDLKEVIETENLFMIMVHGRRGIIIPKSAVNADEVRGKLRFIAEEYNVRYRIIRRVKK